MRQRRYAISIFLLLAAILSFFWVDGGRARVQKGWSSPPPAQYGSYKDIPGVSPEEIAAITKLQKEHPSFVYAVLMSTEAFRREDGSIGGFSSLFCQWLSELFGIRFEPTFYEWDALIDGLASRKIDFSGELTATEQRRATYFMTDAVATRTIKYMRLFGATPLADIAKSRPLRFGFLPGTTIPGLVRASGGTPFTAVEAEDYAKAYALLKARGIDAFFDDGPSEAAFDMYPDVTAENFFPLLFSPVSLATRNPELQPVISVVQKALQHGADYHLTQLYNQGHQAYLRHKLYMRLDGEERRFIKERLRAGHAIPVGFEYDNYPVSFYNMQEKAWQGIALDVLKEIEILTGLRFIPDNHPGMEWPEILARLERGDIAMVSELIHSKDRAGRFLWPSTPYLTDYYALLSRSDYPDIHLNEILYSHVGLIKDSAYAEAFHTWFPDHKNITEYIATTSAFDALERGDIDLLMAPRGLLLSVTNYMERPGFKINLSLQNPYQSSFGLNKNQRVLCSIIGKAQNLIDTRTIANGWMRRIFDYRGKLARAQVPYLIGVSALLACILILLAMLLIKNRQAGRRLEALVYERTREMEEQTRVAQSASRAKSEFLANMSHEIRTPLNAVIGLGELELRKEHSEGTRDNLEKMHNSGMILLSIINDLLDISKIESGRFELVPVAYSLPSLLQDTICLNMVRIGDKPIVFHVQVDESLPAKLYGDELRIKQVMNNLLSNAFKYTRQGSVILEVSCEPRSGDDGDIWLRCTVTDTGIGIRPDDIGKLFSKYNQVDTRSNRLIEGTGLGLSICKNLVEMMGGSIAVTSEYGQGSTFTVRFRQPVMENTPIGREITENLSQFLMIEKRRDKSMELKPADLSHGSVLVVDDVRVNLDVAEGMLELYGLRIDCVTSGREAIERIRAETIHYDVIFMDHMMPEMDGMEATCIIRNEINTNYAKTVPIIALTANALSGNREMFLENGFQGFLAKPIDSIELDAVLRQWIPAKHED